MKFNFSEPYLIFYSSSILTVSCGLLLDNSSLDFNYGDTFYVINYLVLAMALAFLLSLIGTIYWLLQKSKFPLSKQMGQLHAGFTLGGILLALLLSQGYSDFHEFQFNAMLTSTIHLVLALTFAAQLILLFNVIRALKK